MNVSFEVLFTDPHDVNLVYVIFNRDTKSILGIIFQIVFAVVLAVTLREKGNIPQCHVFCCLTKKTLDN